LGVDGIKGKYNTFECKEFPSVAIVSPGNGSISNILVDACSIIFATTLNLVGDRIVEMFGLSFIYRYL
jgi:hypothetical protein